MALPINHRAESSNFLFASGATGPTMMLIEPLGARFVSRGMGMARLRVQWTSD